MYTYTHTYARYMHERIHPSIHSSMHTHAHVYTRTGLKNADKKPEPSVRFKHWGKECMASFCRAEMDSCAHMSSFLDIVQDDFHSGQAEFRASLQATVHEQAELAVECALGEFVEPLLRHMKLKEVMEGVEEFDAAEILSQLKAGDVSMCTGLKERLEAPGNASKTVRASRKDMVKVEGALVRGKDFLLKIGGLTKTVLDMDFCVLNICIQICMLDTRACTRHARKRFPFPPSSLHTHTCMHVNVPCTHGARNAGTHRHTHMHSDRHAHAYACVSHIGAGHAGKGDCTTLKGPDLLQARGAADANGHEDHKGSPQGQKARRLGCRVGNQRHHGQAGCAHHRVAFL